MKKKYRITDNRRRVLESQKRIDDLSEELKKNENIKKELYVIGLENEKFIDVRNKNNVHRSINDALGKTDDIKASLTNKLEKEADEMKKIQKNISNLLEDSKKQSESLRKKDLLKRFDEVSQGANQIERDVQELMFLENALKGKEKFIEKFLEKNSEEVDFFESIPDKEETSWEIEELLNERKIRAEALEEICTGTQEIFETRINTEANPLGYAKAAGDAFTTTVNVVAISTALISEAIVQKIKK